MIRRPNARRSPPEVEKKNENLPKLINNKTQLISILNENTNNIKTDENKQLKPMPLFPPYFKLNSSPKCPNFNPLLKNNLFNCYNLEKLDDDINLPQKIFKFLKKVQNNLPLYNFDELSKEITSKIDHFENEQKNVSNPASFVSVQDKVDYDSDNNKNSVEVKKLNTKENETLLPWLDFNKSDDFDTSLFSIETSYQDVSLSNINQNEVLNNKTSTPILEENNSVQLFKNYLSENDYEYLCILMAAEESKEFVLLCKHLREITLLLKEFSETMDKFEYKTMLTKRKLKRLLSNLAKIINTQISNKFDTYLDIIFKNMLALLTKTVSEIKIVDKQFLAKTDQMKSLPTPILMCRNSNDSDVDFNLIRVNDDNLTESKECKISIKELTVEKPPEEDYYKVYQRLTNFNVR